LAPRVGLPKFCNFKWVDNLSSPILGTRFQRVTTRLSNLGARSTQVNRNRLRRQPHQLPTTDVAMHAMADACVKTTLPSLEGSIGELCVAQSRPGVDICPTFDCRKWQADPNKVGYNSLKLTSHQIVTASRQILSLSEGREINCLQFLQTPDTPRCPRSGHQSGARSGIAGHSYNHFALVIAKLKVGCGKIRIAVLSNLQPHPCEGSIGDSVSLGRISRTSAARPYPCTRFVRSGPMYRGAGRRWGFSQQLTPRFCSRRILRGSQLDDGLPAPDEPQKTAGRAATLRSGSLNSWSAMVESYGVAESGASLFCGEGGL